MAGFNYECGRSNNMVAAESRGLITIGRWAKRHGVSAAAAVAVMNPNEAHHTGTGRFGKSRLTPVIDADATPTNEQLAEMKAFDAKAAADKAAAPTIYADCVCRYLTFPTSRCAKSRRPTEHVEKVAAVELFAAGEVACVETSGRRTIGWHKLAGLVVAVDGKLIYHHNVNLAYDDVDAIVARISPK